MTHTTFTSESSMRATRLHKRKLENSGMENQERLLDLALNKYRLSPQVVAAYKKLPRHLFIKRSYSMDEMYGDYPLEIYRDEKYISTISQPSFVMLMIDMLDLKPGHKVLELGAGSGWNAALMGEIVGPAGKVVSVEIIPSLAQETKDNLSFLGIANVEIISGDGATGYPPEAPYDRGIFTAGATDLPKAFHEQIKVGGKLLFVLKTQSIDLLLLLIKKEDHFEELSRLSCSFVPMKGQKAARITNDLDTLRDTQGKLEIYPNFKKEGRDSLFSIT